MLDWYITHVYVLPWWVYVLMLYPCGSALAFHLADYPNEIIAAVLWPFMVFIYPVVFMIEGFAWLVDIRDDPPQLIKHAAGYTQSLSEGGYIE